MEIRAIIRDVGYSVLGPDGLTETTKWNQPAFLPKRPRIGTTVRINALAGEPGKVALFFHCKTSLVETFRSLYSHDFDFRGNRALVIDAAQPLPRTQIEHCVAMALTYYRK